MRKIGVPVILLLILVMLIPFSCSPESKPSTPIGAATGAAPQAPAMESWQVQREKVVS